MADELSIIYEEDHSLLNNSLSMEYVTTNNQNEEETIDDAPPPTVAAGSMTNDEQIKDKDSKNLTDDETLLPMYNKSSQYPLDNEIVDTLIIWKGTAKQVQVKGEFSNWIPLTMSNTETNFWQILLKLPIGEFLMKFLVDDNEVFNEDFEKKIGDDGVAYNLLVVPNTYGILRCKNSPVDSIVADSMKDSGFDISFEERKVSSSSSSFSSDDEIESQKIETSSSENSLVHEVENIQDEEFTSNLKDMAGDLNLKEEESDDSDVSNEEKQMSVLCDVHIEQNIPGKQLNYIANEGNDVANHKAQKMDIEEEEKIATMIREEEKQLSVFCGAKVVHHNFVHMDESQKLDLETEEMAGTIVRGEKEQLSVFCGVNMDNDMKSDGNKEVQLDESKGLDLNKEAMADSLVREEDKQLSVFCGVNMDIDIECDENKEVQLDESKGLDLNKKAMADTLVREEDKQLSVFCGVNMDKNMESDGNKGVQLLDELQRLELNTEAIRDTLVREEDKQLSVFCGANIGHDMDRDENNEVIDVNTDQSQRIDLKNEIMVDSMVEVEGKQFSVLCGAHVDQEMPEIMITEEKKVVNMDHEKEYIQTDEVENENTFEEDEYNLIREEEKQSVFNGIRVEHHIPIPLIKDEQRELNNIKDETTYIHPIEEIKDESINVRYEDEKLSIFDVGKVEDQIQTPLIKEENVSVDHLEYVDSIDQMVEVHSDVETTIPKSTLKEDEKQLSVIDNEHHHEMSTIEEEKRSVKESYVTTQANDELKEDLPHFVTEQLSVICGLEERTIKDFVEEIKEESIKMMIQEENIQLEVKAEMTGQNVTDTQKPAVEDENEEKIPPYTKEHIQRMSVIFGMQDEKMNYSKETTANVTEVTNELNEDIKVIIEEENQNFTVDINEKMCETNINSIDDKEVNKEVITIIHTKEESTYKSFDDHDKEDKDNDTVDVVKTIVDNKSNEINEPFQIKIDDNKEISSSHNGTHFEVNISENEVDETLNAKELIQDDVVKKDADSLTITIKEDNNDAAIGETNIAFVHHNEEEIHQNDANQSDTDSVKIEIEKDNIKPIEVMSSPLLQDDTDKSDAGSVTIDIEEETNSKPNEAVSGALDVAVLNANNMEEAVQIQEKNINDLESGPSSIISTSKAPILKRIYGLCSCSIL